MSSRDNNRNSLPFSLQAIENLKKTVDAWINNADFKAATVLAFNGAVITIFSTKFPELKKIALLINCNNLLPTIAIIIPALYIATACISLYYVYRTLRPDTVPRTSGSLFFFGSIASMKLNDFQERIMQLDENEAKEIITEQVHTNSIIVLNKFKNISKAIDYLFLSLLFFIFSLFFISFF